ncbi:MAG: hypothetical protein HYX32_06610 [Actinobacteria bacterium]|nr:hypothetical protein [Actinomycetota bacterium]
MAQTIRQELLDELLADYSTREDLTGPDGLLKTLFKRLIETAAGAELTEYQTIMARQRGVSKVLWRAVGPVRGRP